MIYPAIGRGSRNRQNRTCGAGIVLPEFRGGLEYASASGARVWQNGSICMSSGHGEADLLPRLCDRKRQAGPHCDPTMVFAYGEDALPRLMQLPGIAVADRARCDARPASLASDPRALLRDGAFHHQHGKHKGGRHDGRHPEHIEIGQ